MRSRLGLPKTATGSSRTTREAVLSKTATEAGTYQTARWVAGLAVALLVSAVSHVGGAAAQEPGRHAYGAGEAIRVRTENGEVLTVEGMTTPLSERIEAAGADPAAVVHAYEVFLRDTANRLGVPRQLTAALGDAGQRPPAGGTHEIVLPAGDLDRDGVADVVGVAPGSGPEDPATISARRGLDGALLWAHPAPPTTFPHPTRLGPLGADGVLLVSLEVTGSEPGSGSDSEPAQVTTTLLRLTAVSGGGETLWERVFHGVVTATSDGALASGLAFPAGLFDAVEGPADDLLVGVIDLAALPLVAVVTANVLDGADGRTVARAVEPAASEVAEPRPGPDLDGDGLKDVVTAVPGGVESREPGKVSGYAGSDGRRLWTNPDLPVPELFASVDVGDANGDGSGELALGGPSFGDQTAERLTLLSGGDGRLLWARASDMPVALGDVSGDGRPDTGAWTFHEDHAADHLVVGFRYEAMEGDGDPIYATTHTVTLPPTQRVAIALRALGDAGDVTGDGVPDAFQDTFALSDRTLVTDTRIVSGGDGSLVRIDVEGVPLQAHVDAVGDDFAEVTAEPSAATVTAMAGDSGAILWRARHPTRSEPQSWLLRGADLDGDGRGEVIANLFSDQGVEVLVLGAADGRVRWSLPHEPAAATRSK